MSKRTYGIDRRNFLQYMATVSAIATLAQRVEGQVATSPKFGGNRFTLGVASGDPEPDGVVIWTRLALKPVDGGGMPHKAVPVQWEVATDEAFASVVRKGTARAMPQLLLVSRRRLLVRTKRRSYSARESFAGGEEYSSVAHER